MARLVPIASPVDPGVRNRGLVQARHRWSYQQRPSCRSSLPLPSSGRIRRTGGADPEGGTRGRNALLTTWALTHFDNHNVFDYRWMVLPLAYVCGLPSGQPIGPSAQPIGRSA
jgi:hypothetical protein